MAYSPVEAVAPVIGVFFVFGIIGYLARRRGLFTKSQTPGSVLNQTGSSNAFLLSGSCTTGWSDWIHGELWLTDDGLLRVSSGLTDTFLHSGSAAVVGNKAKSGVLDKSKIPEILAKSKHNSFTNKSEIDNFTLTKSVVDGRLRVNLKDGKSRKFLFMKEDMDYELLKNTLEKWNIRETKDNAPLF